MRFHVVGVGGATGSLLSFHIKRTARLVAENVQHLRRLPMQSVVPHWPVPYDVGVALRLHRSSFVRAAAEKTHNSIVIEPRDASRARQREDDFGVQWAGTLDQLGGPFADAAATSTTVPEHLQQKQLPGLSLCEEMGYPTGTIDALLVATKAQSTVNAMRPFVPHLTPASTIVLLQTGQGVLDQVFNELFPDPQSRPNIILASSTHSARVVGRLHTLHEGHGRVDIGVVPNAHIGQNYERLWAPQQSQSIEEIEDDELRRPRRRRRDGVASDDQASLHATVQPIDRRSKEALRKDKAREEKNSASLDAPLVPELDLGAIPLNDHSRTLVHTMAVLLSLPLSVTWHPIRRFQMIALRRLVVAACIEPLTALGECRNGELFGNKHASNMMRDVCKEANQVLKALGERTRKEAQLLRDQQAGEPAAGMSDYMLAPDLMIGDAIFPDAPALDPSLYTNALLDDVKRSIRASGPHYSTMFYDLHHSNPARRFDGSTDIDFLNGYLARLGRSLGVATPVNDMLTSLIKLRWTKKDSSWRHVNRR